MRTDFTAFLEPGFRIRLKPPRAATSHHGQLLHVPWIAYLGDDSLSLHFEGAEADLLRLRDAIDAAAQPGVVRLDPDQPADCDDLVQAAHAELGQPALTAETAQAVLRAIATVRQQRAGQESGS